MSAGCYMLRHKPTSQFYIGATNSLTLREYHHRRNIATGTHRNPNIRSLGTRSEDFEFTVLLVCAPEDRRMYEDRLLTAYQADPRMLNCFLADNLRSEATRERMSVAGKKKIISPEGRARMLAAHLGKKRRPETGAKISEAHKRRPKATHCGKGHPFDEANLYFWTSPTGRTKRRCRACDKLREKGRVRDWRLDGIRRRALKAHKAATA